MKKDTLSECGTCRIKKPVRDIKRIKKIITCKSCMGKRRDKHREFLKRDILGIRKRSDLIKEWKEKRKLKEAISKRHAKEMKKIKSSKYKIQDVKRERRFGRKPYKVSSLGLYITRNEKEVLYQILINKSYSSQEANEHIKQMCEKMRELSIKLNKMKREKEEINIIFKEEFAKLIDRS